MSGILEGVTLGEKRKTSSGVSGSLSRAGAAAPAFYISPELESLTSYIDFPKDSGISKGLVVFGRQDFVNFMNDKGADGEGVLAGYPDYSVDGAVESVHAVLQEYLESKCPELSLDEVVEHKIQAGGWDVVDDPSIRQDFKHSFYDEMVRQLQVDSGFAEHHGRDFGVIFLGDFQSDPASAYSNMLLVEPGHLGAFIDAPQSGEALMVWQALHELAHVRKNHSVTMEGDINRLAEEIEADVYAYERYRSFVEAGDLPAESLYHFEAMRTISALRSTGGSSYQCSPRVDGHATSLALTLDEGMNVLTEDFNLHAVGLAHQHINSLAYLMVAKGTSDGLGWSHEYDPQDGFRGELMAGARVSSVHPLLHYGAVKTLLEKKALSEHTPQYNMAEEFIDAFEKYLLPSFENAPDPFVRGDWQDYETFMQHVAQYPDFSGNIRQMQDIISGNSPSVDRQDAPRIDDFLNAVDQTMIPKP